MCRDVRPLNTSRTGARTDAAVTEADHTRCHESNFMFLFIHYFKFPRNQSDRADSKQTHIDDFASQPASPTALIFSH